MRHEEPFSLFGERGLLRGIVDQVVRKRLAPDSQAAEQLIRDYLARSEDFEYKEPDLRIQTYMQKHPESLQVRAEARGKLRQRTILALGASRPDRLLRQILQFMHGIGEECPDFIIQYRTPQEDSQHLGQELGSNVIQPVQANLDTFTDVQKMMGKLETVPDVQMNAAAPYEKDTVADFDSEPGGRADINFKGIFLNNFWTTLLFALQNKAMGRKALAILFSDWVVETPEAYKKGFGLHPRISYFVSKGGLDMLPSQLKIQDYDEKHEKVTFNPAVEVTIVGSRSDIPPADQDKPDVFIWEKKSNPNLPRLEDLTSENIGEYAGTIERYLRDNLWEPMVQATAAVNKGQRVYLVFPEEEKNWLDKIIRRGVAGVQEVFQSQDLRVDIIAPGPTVPPSDMKPEERIPPAKYSLAGQWLGAGPSATATLASVAGFSVGDMESKTYVDEVDGGRRLVAQIRALLEPTPK